MVREVLCTFARKDAQTTVARKRGNALSSRGMSRSDMETRSDSEEAKQARYYRRRKRKREEYLRHVFSIGKDAVEESDSRVVNIRLTRQEVELLDMIRAGHDAGIWKHLPNDVYEILVEGNIVWKGIPVKKEGADHIPDKGIVLMALKLMHLYLVGASPYHGMILRDMYSVTGKEMEKESIKRRGSRGALYSQIEELGARVEEMNDDDFSFDDDVDW